VRVAGAVPEPAQVPAPVRAGPKPASQRPDSRRFRSSGNRGPAAWLADHGWKALALSGCGRGSWRTKRRRDGQEPTRLEAEADPEAGHPQSPQLAQDSPWLHLPEQRLDGHRGALQARPPGQEQELREGALRAVPAGVRAAAGSFGAGIVGSLRSLCATLSPGWACQLVEQAALRGVEGYPPVEAVGQAAVEVLKRFVRAARVSTPSPNRRGARHYGNQIHS